MEQRTAARLAWSLWVLVLLGAATAIVLQNLQEAGRLDLEDVLFTMVFASMGALGALIVSRQPRNAIGWLFLATTLAGGALFVAEEYWRYAVEQVPRLPGAAWTAWMSDWIWVVLLSIPSTFVPLLFPDGRLPSPRWRPFAWIAGGYFSLAALTFALDPAPGFARLPNPVGVEAVRPLVRFMDGPGFAVVLALAVVALASLILRFRRADGQRRRQIKWFAFGAAVLVAVFTATAIIPALGLKIPPALETILVGAAYMALPLGAGIAILRHRLYDIDVVINRTLLFALLAAFITLVYVGIVVGIGALVGSRGNVLLSIVATALIALAFQPVRTRAGHLANRLVYGKRATPYEVLSSFSDHLEDTYSSEEILPRMARMVGEATGAERSRVWLRVGSELRQAAGWPDTEVGPSLRSSGSELPAFPEGERSFPVRHQGELLGALSVVTSRREPLNPTQEKLISDLAGQAGLILRNVRLIEELRASRQRLVTAQDEERRRLERNIHDGAQQQLVALTVQLRLAQNLAGKTAPNVADLLGKLKEQTTEALDDLRDLARGIYPPLLADQGLAAALQAQARKAPVPVEVDSDGVGRYPQEAEAAAYFCVLEALQNIVKYADASRAVVRLTEEGGRLVFSVQDDGRGFDSATTPKGSGLQNMTDRLEALGGSVEVASSPGSGTNVTGRIPVGGGE
ncbi:MAG: GAF domain-containing sensor histidine kinase [Actinomycetota bacterium]